MADNSGVNVNLASGLTGTINTDAGVTLGVNKLNGDSTTAFDKAGTGTMLMTAANNYSSSTTVSDGTLKAGEITILALILIIFPMLVRR